MSEPDIPQLNDLRVQLAELRKTIELGKEIFVPQKDLQAELRAIRKDFTDLNTQVKVESNFYKWIASTSVFVALVLGVFGYSQWHDIITGLRSRVDQTSEYQFNLAHGIALSTGRRPREAAEFLQKCYLKTPTDQTVAGQLLYSYQSGDDWIKGDELATEVQKQIGIDNIQDQWFLNNIGLSLLYEGRDDPQKLDRAKTLLIRTATQVKDDPDERAIWINLWIYYLFTRNEEGARASLEKAYAARTLALDKTTWDEKDWQSQTTEWSLFTHLAETNKSMKPAADAMISKMLQRHKGEQKTGLQGRRE